MSKTADNSSDSEREQMFTRSKTDDESTENTQDCEMCETADEVENSHGSLDQDFTYLPS